MFLRASIVIVFVSFFFTSCEKDKSEIENVKKGGVHVGSVILHTQSEVDEFVSHSYCSIDGDVIIDSEELVYPDRNTDLHIYIPKDPEPVEREDPIIDLKKLESMKSITGDLIVALNSTLSSLNGLQNIERVGGKLIISKNEKLTDGNWFDNLNEIGEELQIEDNISLKELSEFKNLESVGSYIVIDGVAIEELIGFNHLKEMSRGVSIGSNKSLIRINGFNNLKLINSSYNGISVYSNPKLENLNGFETLESIVGGISISSNPKLIEVKAFPKLKYLEGDKGLLSISECKLLQDFSFCSNILGVFKIQLSDNENLRAIDFFNENLKVTDHVFISDHQNLNDFCGMRAMTESLDNYRLIIYRNLYNPNIEDIRSGNCSN